VDPDPGSGAFLTPGSGESASGSGIRDEQPGSYLLELRKHSFGFLGLKFFYADPGWKSSDPGSGINIRIRNTDQ
jgi:hypothetical protein